MTVGVVMVVSARMLSPVGKPANSPVPGVIEPTVPAPNTVVPREILQALRLGTSLTIAVNPVRFRFRPTGINAGPPAGPVMTKFAVILPCAVENAPLPAPLLLLKALADKPITPAPTKAVPSATSEG